MAIANPETVSIIVPCYNEEKTIRLLLEAVEQQTYPREYLEVIIADGFSVDDTRVEIAAFQARCSDLAVRVIDNPRRNIPTALNLAIQAAQGAIIVRLDAHSMPHSEYVERSVADLQAGLGTNVGGIWQIVPGSSTWIGRSIAVAASHKLGVGDALYRYTAHAQVVDTVPFGAFYRSLIDQIGTFDELLLSNEDYEFNTRVRQAGGTVYLDPLIRSQYFSRPTLGALARQYWRYGFWKFRMLRRYPHTLRWRQALPPAFVAGIIGLLVLSIFWGWPRVLLAVGLGLYLAILIVASVPAALRQRQWALLVGVPLAIATMHFAWGLGFWYSILKPDR